MRNAITSADERLMPKAHALACARVLVSIERQIERAWRDGHGNEATMMAGYMGRLNVAMFGPAYRDDESDPFREVPTYKGEPCPNCGETGGDLVEVSYRHYQGVSPHGGAVEDKEEMCTLCVGDRRTE